MGIFRERRLSRLPLPFLSICSFLPSFFLRWQAKAARHKDTLPSSPSPTPIPGERGGNMARWKWRILIFPLSPSHSMEEVGPAHAAGATVAAAAAGAFITLWRLLLRRWGHVRQRQRRQRRRRLSPRSVGKECSALLCGFHLADDRNRGNFYWFSHSLDIERPEPETCLLCFACSCSFQVTVNGIMLGDVQSLGDPGHHAKSAI